MSEVEKEINPKKESISHLLGEIFHDLEILVRQELDLFIANAEQAIQSRATRMIRYHWLALCVAITGVFSALTLVEVYKTIPGISSWTVYALSGATFLALGLIGYANGGAYAKKKKPNKEKEKTEKLATVHPLIKGEEKYA